MQILRDPRKSALSAAAIVGLAALLVLIMATAALGFAWLPGQKPSEPVAAPHALHDMHRPSMRTQPVPTLPPPPTPRPVVQTPTPKQAAPVAAPRVAVPSGSVAQRVAAAWPGDDRKVLCLVGIETGHTFDPNIVGPVANDGSRYLGLFQADATFRRTYGWGSGSVEDQVAMAWRGFQARGWQPWPPAARC